MDKVVILLTKAEDREDALHRTREFLQGYGDGRVWDRYQVGGYWTAILSPRAKEFREKAKEILVLHPDNKDRDLDFVTQRSIDDSQSELQQLWQDMGMQGQNPYCDHYNLPEEGGIYDVLPLSECFDIVKEWYQNPVERGKEKEKEAQEWVNGKIATNDYNMYGYCLKIAGNLYSQNFCFDCNTFNIEEGDYSVPEDLVGWWAVVVDMHN